MKALIYHVTLFLLIAGGVIGLPACAQTTASSPPLTPITVQLTWVHSAQFAGFYAADQHGDYAAEGLVVTFIEGGPVVDRLTPVLNGEAQFGLAGGVELIPARANGSPLRAVATILRRDPFAFFALAESGISRPEDFVGKKLWVLPQALPYLQAMTGRVGVTSAQYMVVEDASFASLYSGDIDVAIGFVTSQGVEAERAGYKLNIIYPDDYGVHLTSDNIFVTDDLIATNPELVTRFLRATFKGWDYVIEHPDEAGSLVTRYNPQADIALENDIMLASIPLVNTGEDYIGWMKPEVWAGMEQTLRAQGVLADPIDVDEVYTMQFLQEIYQK